MRNALFALLLMPVLCAAAQSTASGSLEGSNWRHVQALPLGASLYVKTRTSHAICKLKSVDADTLTCTHGTDSTFQRSDILAIRIPHRGRSALIGAAVGGGVGAGVGFAAGTNNTKDPLFGPNFLRGAVAGVGAAIGAVAGGVAGGLTDFSHSTVYKAP